MSKSSIGTQALRYGLVGAINTVVGATCIYTLYHVMDVSLVTANLLGYAIGFSISYAMNKNWTFGVATPDRGTILRFVLVMGAALCVNIWLTATLISAGLSYNIAQAIGIATYTVLGFLGSRYVVFRSSEAPQ